MSNLALIKPHSKKIHCFLAEVDTSMVRSISTWLHVTNSCDLNCPYCYIANKNGGRMSLAIASAYLDKLEMTVNTHHLKAVSVRIAGGEPTLHKELIHYVVSELKRRFVTKGIQLQLIIITNGTTLSESWLQFITSHGIRLCVSLDGVEEWHDKMRFFENGKGSFSRIARSLNLCAVNGVKPRILTTITDDNVDGIPSLSRFLIDSHFPFRYGIFRDSVGGYIGYQRFVEKVNEVLDDCYCYYASAVRGHRVGFAHQLSDIHLDRKKHLRSCNVGRSGVTVNHLGQVFFCQAQMDKGTLGTLWDKATFLEMAWSQQTFPELNTKNVFDYGRCRDCRWALICGGGCPVVNANASGLATIASPYCELFQFAIPRLIELKALDLINKLRTPNSSERKEGKQDG